MIGEDDSDIATLKVLVRRLANNNSLAIKGKGYSGCGEMLRKGAQQLRSYCQLGCTKLIVCYDSDGASIERRRKDVEDRILTPACISKPYAVIIPVEELEAWILADIKAVTKVFPTWRPKAIASPESVRSPKEHLEKLSRNSKKRPRYSHVVHNEVVAHHLDLTVLRKKCSSFRELQDFICDLGKQKKKK